MATIRLNITDDQGTLLGQVEMTPDELRLARYSPNAAVALADEIATEVGDTILNS